MSQAGTIDGPRFAQERARVAGRLSLAALSRLADSGCTRAEVAYSVEGGTSARGHPSLAVRAHGGATMNCQRCLGPLEVPIAVDATLELAASRDAAEAADDDVDRVIAARHMDVAELVEDELLLALPMVAAHAECGWPANDDGPKPSPFAALAGLRKGSAD
jgi:uncharacterized protein